MSEIYGRLSLVMGEIGAIAKNRTNPQQGYKFRGIDDVYGAVNAALVKHGVFCVPSVEDMKREERQTQKGGMLFYTILTIKYTFFAPDGSCVEVKTVGEAMDSGDKSCNKAMSAAQKYAFLQLFCIPTEEPKDTENETYEVIPPQPPVKNLPATSKKNFKFLEAMQAEKKRIGERNYYYVLGKCGYEKSLQIPDDKIIQTAVYNELRQITNKEEEDIPL